MSLKITQRHAADITILDLSGRLTLGDGSSLYRDTLKDLVASGRRKILVNLEDVQYVDSSGLGEIVSGCTTVMNAGGAIKFMGAKGRVRDLLIITTIMSFLESLPMEDDIARVFDLGVTWRCPLCMSGLYPVGGGQTTQACAGCGATMYTEPDSKGLRVVRIDLSTYDDEVFRLEFGAPSTLRVIGRLNFATSRGIDRLWRIVPKPRRLLIEIDDQAELSGEGRLTLQRLIEPEDTLPRAALLLTSQLEIESGYWNGVRGVCRSREEALAALGPWGEPPSIYLAPR